NEHPDRTVSWRHNPGLAGELRQVEFTAAGPWVLQPRHNGYAIIEQDFGLDVLLVRLHDSSDNEIDLSLAQFAVLLRYGPHGCHINGDTRILLSEPAEYRRNQAGNDEFIACDPDFTDRRIGQELDALHALTQLIEDGCTAAEQCAAVLSRLDTSAAAIEQTHAERMFQLGDRP